VFEGVYILISARSAVLSQPRVTPVAHQPDFAFELCKEGNVAIGLMLGFKELLLCHLGVIDKGDELPLTKVDYFLRYILGQINNTYFMIIWCKMLVGKKWVVDDVFLLERGLWIFKLLLFFLRPIFLVPLRGVKLQHHVTGAKLLVDNRANDALVFRDVERHGCQELLLLLRLKE
jgi:hypothetical protein